MAPTSQFGPGTSPATAGSRPTGYNSTGYGSLPPPPRKAGVLPDSELLSGDDIRSGGVIALFKTEPLLNRKCVAFYLRFKLFMM